MATRRFNPKTGRYEDVVSSKGFRLPQLSLPKFSLFQTDRQIKDLTQSSKKAKRRSTEPAHKRVEKLKAENITRSIAEAESIARSALETGTARARAEAVKAVAKLAEVKTQAESKLERLTPTETATVNNDEHEPLRLPAPKDSFEPTSQPLQEESKGDFFFDFPLKDEDKSDNSSGNKVQFKKIAMFAGIILTMLFSLSIVFNQPYTNSYVNKSRSSVSNTSKKYSPTEISGVSTQSMSGESGSTSSSSSPTSTKKTSTQPVNRILHPTEWEKEEWKKNEKKYRKKAQEDAEFDLKYRRDRLDKAQTEGSSLLESDRAGYYYRIVINSEQYMRDAWEDAGFTQEEIELMVELAKEYTPEQ
ncbi:hypothetical protein [Lancefieldella rimae]|uniref:hypothetical protein n=1 Tax=Lancefieldella rimae TaxID=1383 RepID=UPI0028801474|nr:hypothetical protein [Lancefieldella rimae]